MSGFGMQRGSGRAGARGAGGSLRVTPCNNPSSASQRRKRRIVEGKPRHSHS